MAKNFFLARKLYLVCQRAIRGKEFNPCQEIVEKKLFLHRLRAGMSSILNP